MSVISASNTTFRAARKSLGLSEQAEPKAPQNQPDTVQLSYSKPDSSVKAILRGIQYAQKSGASITSNSWGAGASTTSPLWDLKSPTLPVDTVDNPTTPTIPVIDTFDFTEYEPIQGASEKQAFDRISLTGDVSEREGEVVAGHGTHVAMILTGPPSKEAVDALRGSTLAVSDENSESVVTVSKSGNRIEMRDADESVDGSAFIDVSDDNQGTLNFFNGSTKVSVELGEFDKNSALAGPEGLSNGLPDGPIDFMAVTDHSIEARVNHNRYWIDRQQAGDWQLSGLVGS